MSTDLQRFFPVARFGAIVTVAPITGGLSGAGVFAVTTAGGAWVLRLHAGDRTSFEHQLAAHRLGAAQGVAPALLHVDAAAQATVAHQVAGVHYGMALANPATAPLALRRLAGQLGQLHRAPAPPLPPLDLAQLTSVWRQQSARAGFPPWALALQRVVDTGLAALVDDPRVVFSHGDVTPMNVLWDGERPWLVDWERACLAHPYLDLAVFANFANLDSETARALLALQELEQPSPAQWTTFGALRDLASALYGAVFLRLVPDLQAVAFADRDATPTLRDCYLRMAKGELDMATPAAHALLGGAMLRQPML